MLQKKQFCFIGLLFMFALLGFQTQTFAEQVNKSVKDCLEQPDACGEQQTSKPEERPTEGLEKNPEIETASNTVGLTLWDFIKMIVATIFVVALLYSILKFINKKSSLYKRSQLIENLGGTTLGGNRSVQIIKVGQRLLVVGVGENIQLLKEIDEDQEYEHLISAYNNKMDQLVQPSDIVTKVMKKVKGNTDLKSEETPPTFQSLLSKQLNELSLGRKKLYDEMEKEKGSDKQ
ncbi:flagellar biosynthetic protein FliO [Bacillus sp. V3B]|uniref:flagellar biosynthetic protein FliO n=1 Tax=Bacillus sp. V3B TaxID=2804915 RepID=UPI00210EA257|nr:flagellar biosynthetic protein FliO [Bacillus sp. V3B]MCQ6274106.1 flagellar biosynthetic protein FliO [Bacillus sp. V3B]